MADKLNDNQDQMQSLIDQIIGDADDLKNNGVTLLGRSAGAVTEGVAKAQKIAEDKLQKLADDKSSIRDSGADGWQGMKDSFHDWFAKRRVEGDYKSMDRDVTKAGKKADKAEDNAIDALTFALSSIDSAQVAVLDAIQARSYADELDADMSADA